jgi:hypothetical protein
MSQNDPRNHVQRGTENDAPRPSAKETARRKKLSEKIEHLGSIEHGEIFRKLKMHNLGYTQNSNGIFVDITDIPGDVVDEMIRNE